VRGSPPEKDPLTLVAGGLYARSLQPFAERFGDRLLVLVHDDLAVVPDEVFAHAVAHVGASPGFHPSGLQRVVHSNRGDAPTSQQALTQEERVALWEYFRDDVHEHESMIGRDLSIWDPTVTSRAGTSA
jgi:hypothetical protein